MLAQGTVVLTDFEPIYHSFNALELAVRAFSDVADDWCEDDLKHALVKLLSENLTHQLQQHQQIVFGSLARIEP
ncbi:hypothetical protein [Shewanella xiamenensis]|uniref:hypothetical protein n=1 Tax=Shewanella xiamenensis TaxID=332186 RepID=UPI0011866F64|nr:hypothetical protein [Shewanella xiamenensis]MBW0298095.1 hypothetical protein [Shewanella xiamenensis]MBW0298101.1 hypothetical protein [Shewanella xiamenensis]TVL33919.1 hypothetical protein AYI95_04935 [Shewanella xiamenensis]